MKSLAGLRLTELRGDILLSVTRIHPVVMLTGNHCYWECMSHTQTQRSTVGNNYRFSCLFDFRNFCLSGMFQCI